MKAAHLPPLYWCNGNKQILSWNRWSTVVLNALFQIFGEPIEWSIRRSGAHHGRNDRPITPGLSTPWRARLNKWLPCIIWILHLKSMLGACWADLTEGFGGAQRQQNSQHASAQFSHLRPPHCWPQKRSAANRAETLHVIAFKRGINCIVC